MTAKEKILIDAMKSFDCRSGNYENSFDRLIKRNRTALMATAIFLILTLVYKIFT